jgi:allantoate deiminase
MPISLERLQRDLETIARSTHTPGRGADRPTFSVPWSGAVGYVIHEATSCGCCARRDAAGNVHIKPSALVQPEADATNSKRKRGNGDAASPASPLWLSGSHLDSVPAGGDFDGVVGVIVPLEVLRAAREDGREAPLELVIFADEEGTTFGLGMIGSRAWTGQLDVTHLAELRNARGENYLQAGAPYGVTANRLAADRFEPADYRGMIEVHIEQGPGLWNRGQPLALVTAIAGRRQYQIEVAGAANHAGSTSMADRHDALAGAAEMIIAVESLPAPLGPNVVATVGRIECQPNAANVIASSVSVTIDFRAAADEILERGHTELRRRLAAIADRRRLELQIEEIESIAATTLSRDVCSRLKTAAKQVGIELPETHSGALHDAAVIAPHLPTAMLFVASRDGISHNPAEFSRLDDIGLATRILYTAIVDGDEVART